MSGRNKTLQSMDHGELISYVVDLERKLVNAQHENANLRAINMLLHSDLDAADNLWKRTLEHLADAR